VVGFAKLVVQTVAVVGYGTPPIKTYGRAIATTLGVAFESNPIYNSCLLGKGKQVGFTV
jgi:hypothetical protein